MNRASKTPKPTPKIRFGAVTTPAQFLPASRVIEEPIQSLSLAPSPSPRPLLLSQSPVLSLGSRLRASSWHDDKSDNSKGSTSSESSSSSDSKSSNRSRRSRKWKWKLKKAKKTQKTGPWLSNKEKKIVLHICVQDFEVYAHAKTKKRFWEHIWEKVKKETGKDHASLHKPVKRWENSWQRVLKLITKGKFSGEEEDDREFLIAIDEWISLLDGFRKKQEEREVHIGKAKEETRESRWIQENLGHWWAQKERSPAINADDPNLVVINDDQEVLQTPLPPQSSTSQSSIHVELSISVWEQTLTISSHAPKRAWRQPPPSQPLADIAEGLQGLVAEFKAEREGGVSIVPVAQEVEQSNLNVKVKKQLKSVESRLAASEQKQNLVLLILLKMEERDMEKEREKEMEG